MVGIPLLIIANKKDVSDAADPAEISKLLDLGSVNNLPWSIRQTSAISGEGLDDAFKWYTSTM